MRLMLSVMGVSFWHGRGGGSFASAPKARSRLCATQGGPPERVTEGRLLPDCLHIVHQGFEVWEEVRSTQCRKHALHIHMGLYIGYFATPGSGTRLDFYARLRATGVQLGRLIGRHWVRDLPDFVGTTTSCIDVI